jgi:hypothetical protein
MAAAPATRLDRARQQTANGGGSWRHCFVAYSADVRSERKRGVIAWCADCGSRARSVPPRSPKKTSELACSVCACQGQLVLIPYLFLPRGERCPAESSPLAGEMVRLDGYEQGASNRPLTWPSRLKLSPGKRGGSWLVTERKSARENVRNQAKKRQTEHPRSNPFCASRRPTRWFAGGVHLASWPRGPGRGTLGGSRLGRIHQGQSFHFQFRGGRNRMAGSDVFAAKLELEGLTSASCPASPPPSLLGGAVILH